MDQKKFFPSEKKVTMSISIPAQMDVIPGLVRRFAAIPQLGKTEPIITPGFSIPQAPEDTPSGQATVQRHNPKRFQHLRASIRRKEREFPAFEIEAVEFNLYSTKEIDQYSVVRVRNPAENGPETVRDTRMGPYNESIPCDTCSKDLKTCPGHNGRIVLPFLMHPLAINSLVLVLSCICNSCSKLLASKAEIEQEGINRMTGIRRLQAIKELVKRLDSKCRRVIDDPSIKKCEVNPIYVRGKDYKDDYRLAYTYPGRKDKTLFYKNPSELYDILDPISDEDAQLLGFVYGSHPRNMIIQRLVVIPYCARPDLYQGEKFFPDDLTTMYIDIVKKVMDHDSATSEASKISAIKDLFFKVSHLMKNDGHYKQGNAKIYTDIKKRIQGKTAIIRGNLMGKRVNFSGRTVVGPAAYLRVDQAGIPRQMAAKLTRPIRVIEMNRAELQSKYDNGKATHIIPSTGPWAGSRVMINDQWKQNNPDLILQIGDVVERMLEDGDIILINRQPTLHKQNIMAVHAKIIDDRVVRINLSVTTPLNAKPQLALTGGIKSLYPSSTRIYRSLCETPQMRESP